MVGHEHALKLLGLAHDDLNALKGMQYMAREQPGYFTDEMFGFHAQQSVEKALKAWLADCGIQYPHTHDLQALLELLEDAGQSVEAMSDVVDFGPYAVQYRYDYLHDMDEAVDRDAVLNRVEEVYQTVALNLGVTG